MIDQNGHDNADVYDAAADDVDDHDVDLDDDNDDDDDDNESPLIRQ